MTATPEWLQRAGLLKQAGANGLQPAELAAVHAGLFPDAEAVRTGCRKCVLDAYQAVLRALRLAAESDSSLSTSFAMSKNQARFLSDDTQYTAHNDITAYSNANLTDGVARRILASDPDAERLFETLPGEQEEEPGQSLSPNGNVMKIAPVDEDESDEDESPKVVLSDRMHRDELEAIYYAEVPEGDAKDYANKADLIAAIEAFRAKA